MKVDEIKTDEPIVPNDTVETTTEEPIVEETVQAPTMDPDTMLKTIRNMFLDARQTDLDFWAFTQSLIDAGISKNVVDTLKAGQMSAIESIFVVVDLGNGNDGSVVLWNRFGCSIGSKAQISLALTPDLESKIIWLVQNDLMVILRGGGLWTE